MEGERPLKYVQATLSHHGNAEWRAYVPALDDVFIATSRAKVEYNVFRAVEEAEGLKSFSIVWTEC